MAKPKAEDRIAAALERIASAMETENAGIAPIATASKAFLDKHADRLNALADKALADLEDAIEKH